jgi:hypothetical protein
LDHQVDIHINSYKNETYNFTNPQEEKELSLDLICTLSTIITCRMQTRIHEMNFLNFSFWMIFMLEILEGVLLKTMPRAKNKYFLQRTTEFFLGEFLLPQRTSSSSSSAIEQVTFLQSQSQSQKSGA